MGSVGAVVLAGVQRRSVVQMVDLGKRPGSMRVPVHRRRNSVHPTVMGQLIVLGMKLNKSQHELSGNLYIKKTKKEENKTSV